MSFVCLSVCLSACLSVICLSAYLSACLFRPSVYLSVCLSASVWLPVFLYALSPSEREEGIPHSMVCLCVRLSLSLVTKFQVKIKKLVIMINNYICHIEPQHLKHLAKSSSFFNHLMLSCLREQTEIPSVLTRNAKIVYTKFLL